MRVFLDTNILMDLFVGNQRPNYASSVRILNAAEMIPELVGVVSVQSITDLSYSLAKYGSENRRIVFDRIRYLLSFLELVTISPDNARAALANNPEDFEDEEQLLCAADQECSWFITGEKRLLDLGERSGVRIISPESFLKLASRPLE